MSYWHATCCVLKNLQMPKLSLWWHVTQVQLDLFLSSFFFFFSCFLSFFSVVRYFHTMMPDVDCTTEQLSGINKQEYYGQISHFTINRLYAIYHQTPPPTPHCAPPPPHSAPHPLILPPTPSFCPPSPPLRIFLPLQTLSVLRKRIRNPSCV